MYVVTLLLIRNHFNNLALQKINNFSQTQPKSFKANHGLAKNPGNETKGKIYQRIYY